MINQLIERLGGQVEDHVVQFIIGQSQRDLDMTYGVHGGSHAMDQWGNAINKLDFDSFTVNVTPFMV